MSSSSASAVAGNSVVSYIGVGEPSYCGYCKSKKKQEQKMNFQKAQEDEQKSGNGQENPEDGKTKKSQEEKIEAEKTTKKDGRDDEGASVVFGLWAHILSPSHYLAFCERGWRRSGQYLYKPIMERTCCPQYTIRLDVHNFWLSRTQKRVLKAMNDFLKNDKINPVKMANNNVLDIKTHNISTSREMQKENPAKNSGNFCAEKKSTEKDHQAKKKYVRKKKAEERLAKKGVDLVAHKLARAAREMARQRTLDSFFQHEEYYVEGEWAHRLEMRLVEQPSDEFELHFDEVFAIYAKYQTVVHNDSPSDLTPDRFRRFLAASPLTREELGAEQSPRLGSYHQHYILDGRIIAVAVLDLLPRCLSSKYFFYDPDYDHLTLGTYSALREIAFVQELSASRPNLHYYYMGFYVYNCPKMQYKGRFRPSELLCDKCFQWVPLTECERLLVEAEGSFTTFHSGAEPPDTELAAALPPIDQARCYIDGHLLRFGDLRELLQLQGALQGHGEQQEEGNEGEEDEDGSEVIKKLCEKVENFVRFVGPAAENVILAIQH